MAESVTLNIGPRAEGMARREAWEKAWKRDGARSLNDWCKTVLDKAAGYVEPVEHAKKK